MSTFVRCDYCGNEVEKSELSPEGLKMEKFYQIRSVQLKDNFQAEVCDECYSKLGERIVPEVVEVIAEVTDEQQEG